MLKLPRCDVWGERTQPEAIRMKQWGKLVPPDTPLKRRFLVPFKRICTMGSQRAFVVCCRARALAAQRSLTLARRRPVHLVTDWG